MSVKHNLTLNIEKKLVKKFPKDLQDRDKAQFQIRILTKGEDSSGIIIQGVDLLWDWEYSLLYSP